MAILAFGGVFAALVPLSRLLPTQRSVADAARVPRSACSLLRVPSPPRRWRPNAIIPRQSPVSGPVQNACGSLQISLHQGKRLPPR